MLRWSIASVCMGGALEGKLAAAAKAGFRAVEIFENDLTFFAGKPRDAHVMAADLGLEIVALQPLRDFEGMPNPIRARNFERAARKLELMHELGARLLCVCSLDHGGRTASDVSAGWGLGADPACGLAPHPRFCGRGRDIGRELHDS